MKLKFNCHLSEVSTWILLLPALLLINSCVTSEKSTYLQELESSIYEDADSVDLTYRVQAGDNLYIRVITPDPRWSAMFNTLPVSSPTMGVGEHAMDLISYTVRQDGNVDIPYLGLIEVEGMTLSEIQSIMEQAFVEYITDADVTVKLVNNYISILGEVAQPGHYPIFKEQMNIFQALAMAGDADDFSNRKRARLLRETIDGPVIQELDLTDREIIHSDYFYVRPNDVLYIEPMKGKFFALNSFPYEIILSTITTFLLVLSFIQPTPN